MSIIEDCKLINFTSHSDHRGILTSIEQLIDVPIEIKRIFYMHHVTDTRGGHAHRETDQVIVAVSGRLNINLYDGEESKQLVLDDPSVGVFVPRMIFVEMSEFSPDSVCLVLANTYYDMSKSIRTRREYKEQVVKND